VCGFEITVQEVGRKKAEWQDGKANLHHRLIGITVASFSRVADRAGPHRAPPDDPAGDPRHRYYTSQY
jgi:hypothetical protein